MHRLTLGARAFVSVVLVAALFSVPSFACPFHRAASGATAVGKGAAKVGKGAAKAGYKALKFIVG